ncbi:hypothetical protein C8J56DRAFT_1026678 [Mycena floridula]|nr:hypothetical protein C8J56DRAFT_1026678 [Mycena floridula]
MKATKLFLLLSLPILLAQAERFVRFISDDGREYYGDAILLDTNPDPLHSKTARIIKGDILAHYTVTDVVKPIVQLLSPLPNERVRTVRCLAYNYHNHVSGPDAGEPLYPILFYKPWTSLSGPHDAIPVSAGYQAQPDFISSLDYETELVIIIKKKAFNISVDTAMDHVLGYSIGNDVSHRGWQTARGGEPEPQYSMGKGPDGWAPWGPAIVSTSLIPDPENLNLWTKVNGIYRQNSSTSQMIFDVKTLVTFFSMGTTLYPGDIIFSGTPVKLPDAGGIWLVDKDVVEVGLEKVGTSVNTVKYV